MVKFMNTKLIFLDIDGTLTSPGSNTPPDSAIEAIKRAQKNGHKVFLCSGRNYTMLSPLLKYNFDGVIASAGGYVLCEDQLIFDCPMTDKQFQKAMDVFDRNNVFCTIESAHGSFTDPRFKEYLKNTPGKANSELLRWRKQLEKELDIRSLAEYDNSPIYKIIIMATDKASLEEPKKLLSDEFQFCIQPDNSSNIINGEIINLKFNKGLAVQKVCDYYNIPIENSISFGDSMNDLEMIETTACSVVMDNGADALKEIADIIAPSVEEDGLYKVFDQLHLI